MLYHFISSKLKELDPYYAYLVLMTGIFVVLGVITLLGLGTYLLMKG